MRCSAPRTPAPARATTFIARGWNKPKWDTPEWRKIVEYSARLGETGDVARQPAARPILATLSATLEPEQTAGELVKANHFFACLTTIFDDLQPDYGLKPREVDEDGPFSAFTGECAVGEDPSAHADGHALTRLEGSVN
ncbi:MAG: hypothetical protein ACE5I3_02610 [Phycisphaerae bacterium]